MQSDFDRIKNEYARRWGVLLLKGESQRPTAYGYWSASDPSQVFELFRKLQLSRFSSFADLGSGDGVVAAIASLFTRSTGIEADPSLHAAASEIRSRLNLGHALVNSDFLEADLSAYDVIFINPDNYFHRLEQKLVRDFRGTLVLADNMFTPLTLSPARRISVMGAGFSVYMM